KLRREDECFFTSLGYLLVLTTKEKKKRNKRRRKFRKTAFLLSSVQPLRICMRLGGNRKRAREID
ncbi:hypothetical protein CSUI_007267, partial [Cystoisospora suis]